MNMIIRASVTLLLITAIAAGPAYAGTGLTLRDCIDKALMYHPALRSAQESLNAGKGRVTQAASPYLPQVQASTGYAESHSLGGALGESVTKSYTTTLSVNQIIYDFGKTGGGLDAARSGVQSAASDADRVKQEVILNVKQAYYALLQASKLLTVAQQTLDQTEGHLRQAEAFFRAGSKPRFDVTRAEVDVNTARLGMINAKNDVRLRTIALYNAMGIDPRGDIEIEDNLAQPPAVPSLDQIQTEALNNRPEMQKAAADIQAAQARVRTAESNYLPTLSANGSYNWAHGTSEATLPISALGLGEFQSDIKNSWNAGVMLSMPLFEGGLTKGRVSEARANLRALEAQRDGLRQSILLEVNQSYADLDTAAARISVMEISRKKAKENLELAEGRYQAGVGPSLEVTDAQVAFIKAETDHVQALYDYQLSAARLMKALGRGEE
jgi:TolC family type I secretion outer membrane protein